MNRMKAVCCVATTVFACVAARAEDVIVPAGSTRVLESGTYDKIFVNGTCSIPNEAVVTCTSLMVASGDVQNVSFTVGKNAQLTVTGSEKTYIGYDVDGCSKNYGCTFTLEDGAQMTAAGGVNVRRRGTDQMRISAYLVTLNLRENAKMFGSGADTYLSMGHDPSAPASGAKTPEGSAASTVGVATIVNLDRGAALRFSTVRAKYRPNTRINFNGGCISNSWNTTLGAVLRNASAYTSTIHHGTKLYLTSVGGNPIWLYKAAHAHSFFCQSGNGGTYFEGNIELGGVVDDEPGKYNNWLVDPDYTDRYYFNMTSLKTDTVTFKGSIRPKFLRKDFFPTTAKILVSKNARLELNGYSQEFAGISGEGCVTNRGTATSLTINNTDESTIGKVCPNVTLVKRGSGSLAIGTINADTTSVDVQAGSLSVAQTGAFGTLGVDGAAATVDLGAMAANAVGTLALTNYTVATPPSKLPITYTTIADKRKLDLWPVTLDGVPYTALPLSAYAGSLYLGKQGLLLLFR